MSSESRSRELVSLINRMQAKLGGKEKLHCNNDGCWSPLVAKLESGKIVMVCPECGATMPDYYAERAIKLLASKA